MNSILITPKTEQEYSKVMEMLKKMRIKAEPVQEEINTAEPYPTIAQEELDQRIQKSIEGSTASPQKVNYYFKKWRNVE